MTLVLTADATLPESKQSVGSLAAVVGTITFSGSYVSGGDTLDLQAVFLRSGMGRVFGIEGSFRGNVAEYDETNKKLKLYSAANTELTAAAYNAALTASPVPVIIWGR